LQIILRMTPSAAALDRRLRVKQGSCSTCCQCLPSSPKRGTYNRERALTQDAGAYHLRGAIKTGNLNRARKSGGLFSNRSARSRVPNCRENMRNHVPSSPFPGQEHLVELSMTGMCDHQRPRSGTSFKILSPFPHPRNRAVGACNFETASIAGSGASVLGNLSLRTNRTQQSWAETHRRLGVALFCHP